MKRVLTGALLGLVLVANAFTSAAPAIASTSVVPFDAFGYRDTILERGANASLSVFVPVANGLRSVHLHAPITISPQADPGSSIEVTANDIPVSTISVRSAGRTPTIDVTIPVPHGAKSLSVAIVGRLFELGGICSFPRDDVWFTVSNAARLTVTTDDAQSNDQIADFLNQYGGTFVVVDRGNNDDSRSAAMQLAYRLHQVERWRRTTVTLGGATGGDTRRVVVGPFPQDAAVRGNELDLTPRGVGLIDDRIDRMLIAPKVLNGAYTPSTDRTKMLTLDDLGVNTRTLRGAGELPFDIPVTYGAFGGIPQHLRIHVDLVHTPIRAADRAYVQVLVNNTLLGSYDMTGANSTEQFDVPLDVDAVSSSNVIRVVPTFFYERDACKGNYPSFTATLEADTNFQWDSIDRRQLSVGDFIRAASGNVGILIDDPAHNGAAFALVSALGTVNANVRSIDVKPFAGTVPSGYDYAIVVGAPDKVNALNAPLQINGQDFTIYAHDGKTVRYRADYSSPFGVLETADAGGTPTLVETYWKDAGTLDAVNRLNPDDLAAQTDNVYIFNSHEATYTDTLARVREHRNDVSLTAPLVIGLFFLLLLVIVFFASRRKV